MNEIHVQHLKHRARIRGDATPEVRDRIAHALAQMLDEGLESALLHAGVDGDEEICIKRFVTRAHLDFARSDRQITSDWSLAWIDALRDVLRSGGDNVVRYRARVHVLVDMATRILRRDGSRIWAWRQLGVWPDTPVDSPAAAVELAQVLARHESAILPVCGVLARERLLGSWLAQLPARSLRALTMAALRAAGADAALDERRAHESDAPMEPAASARPVRLLSASPLSTELLPIVSPENVLELAALALLAADPVALRGAGAAPTLREAGRQWLATGAITREVDAHVDVTRRHAGARTAAALRSVLPRPDEYAPESEQARTDSDEHTERATNEASETEAMPAPATSAVNAAAHTEFGGLTYLLWLIEPCGVLEAVNAGPLASRGLRWTLRHLALQLLPLESGDPVLSAFTGLPPRESEEPEQDPVTPAEAADIAVLTNRLEEQLRERLGESRSREVLLDTVCRRAADIHFEPGWIELHFKLDAASTAIRRAGLDRDLGWVPWLGTVVKFAYV